MGRRLATLTVLALASAPVRAHHPLGGKTPTSLVDGLLSGLGHPVIGLDHLAFVLLAGIVGGLSGRLFALPLLFVAGTLGGTLLRAGGLMLPGTEFLIAASVFGVALYAVAARPSSRVAGAALVAAGLVHGLAYGDAVIGAEPTPLAGYLVALAAVQATLACGTALAARASAERAPRAAFARFAAAGVAGVGFVYLFEMLEGAVLGTVIG